MNAETLLLKLIAIEQAIGKKDQSELRRMVIDAEDYLLGIQKSTVQRLMAYGRTAHLSVVH